ncbi:AMP-binding protein [Massilia sp. Se16.2.3]|nr:AMP-binding protein [Massilia sp. Se16.2.3]
MALSHRNLVAGAASSARCLGMAPGDRIHCTIGLHRDYGLNALLATLAAGATAVLDSGSGPAALTRLLERGEATGLLAAADTLRTLSGAMPRGASDRLRFLACAGGGLDRPSLDLLRAALPRTRIHLLHDIGDACRATSLMPSQLDAHPGSIGRALPYADLRVVRPDGRECAPGETGELVRRGDLVPLGYWNDARASARQLRLLPSMAGLSNRETGHFPGASARRDADGYLYPADVRGDTILTGGYRVSPREVEKIVVGTGLVLEAAAVGIAHPVLGQVIALLATSRPGARLDSNILFGACRARLPRHMLPAMIDVRRARAAAACRRRPDRPRPPGRRAGTRVCRGGAVSGLCGWFSHEPNGWPIAAMAGALGEGGADAQHGARARRGRPGCRGRRRQSP